MKTRKSVIMALLLGLCALAAAFGLSDADFQTAANADGGVTITKYTGWDADITIPAAIGGKTVTAIGKEAFKNCDLTGVVIPDSVKTIGRSAFYGIFMLCAVFAQQTAQKSMNILTGKKSGKMEELL
jgi:hypothetical protein